MTFLISINCTMLYGLWAFFIAARSANKTAPARRIAALLTFLGSTIISGAIFLPLSAPHLGLQHSIPVLLAGAILTALGCGVILRGPHHAGMRGHFDAAALAALLGSAYLAFTAFDHLRFFDDTENTGFLDASIAAEAGIQCAHGFLLVRIDPQHRSATYRCPHNIVFGDTMEQPFVPWPSYREGTSTELARAIQRLQASGRTSH